MKCLLAISNITQPNPHATWAYVPMQDFSPSSDIDWSKTIAEIDLQLYEKYHLSPEERAFIEEKVMPMD